jgi:hypothetical protein
VYIPRLPPAFVSAFLRDDDPSSDPVLHWDEACASLANALVARGVGEAAGVVVKRARRLGAKQPTRRVPAAAAFDPGVDSDSEDPEDRARRDALRDHRFYAVVEMARWDDAELRERVFPRVGSPRRGSSPRDKDDDEGDDDEGDDEDAAEAEDARRRHPVGRALVPGLLFGEAVEFRPHLEAGATSSDRRVAAEGGGAASGNSRRERVEAPLRAKAPFSTTTRAGWFDTGETRDTANRRGARVHEGPCSRCREACRVPFRPVEGGRPPVCGQCFGKDGGGGA